MKICGTLVDYYLQMDYQTPIGNSVLDDSTDIV
jgi:hypothetical protein